MSNLVQDINHSSPELVDIIKEMEHFAYSHGYGKVFNDFVEWLVFQHQFPPAEKNPLKNYSETEQKRFLSMYQTLQKEVRNRVSLWNKDETYYDPLGKLYENIKSHHKSSLLGQFFTPIHIVDMMTKIVDISENRGEVIRILDPACGSGRFGLAASTHAMGKGIPTWVTMNDIDPVCTNMTAVNMALNGVVGEAVCMDGLDIEGHSFRFAYRVEPIYFYIPEGMRELYRLAILSKTQQDIKKQYILRPLSYEETFLSLANKELLKQWGAAKKIEDENSRKAAIESLENKIKARLKGTLFEDDDTLIKDFKLQSEELKKPPSKNDKLKPPNKQGNLFT